MNARFYGRSSAGFFGSSQTAVSVQVQASPCATSPFAASSFATSLFVTGLFLASLFVNGCGGPPPEPVAELRLEEAEWRLPYPEWRTLTLAWTPRQELSADAVWCFVHLKDDAGEVVRTFDHEVRGDWQVGEELRYELTLFQSVLAPGLAPGAYSVELGLYDPASGERWPLRIESASAEPVGQRAYRVAQLDVPQATPDAPRLTFSTGWTPPAAGTDRQILARRWLSGEGQLTVGDLDVPGSLWMRLRVPEPEAAGTIRLLDDAVGGQPRLELTSTCTGRVHNLDVPGVHELVLPVYAAAPQKVLGGKDDDGVETGFGIGGRDTGFGAAGVAVAGAATSCELQFWANYVVELEPGRPPRSVALEALSWTAAQL